MYLNILDHFKGLQVFCIKDEYSSELFNNSETIQDYPRFAVWSLPLIFIFTTVY